MKPLCVCRHVPHEGLGSLAERFDAAGIAIAYSDMWDHPPSEFDPAAHAGLIVMGGPMNVNETGQHPLLAAEVDWIRAAIDAGLPTLGICLGSQLIAKSLGARVYAGAAKEIGWYAVDTTPEAADDPLFSAWRPRETVFQWHGDTFELPSGAVRLASSPLYENQAFRFGEKTYGLQFHIEVTAAMVRQWVEDVKENRAELAGLDHVDAAAILAETPTALPGMIGLGQSTFAPWIDWLGGKCGDALA